MENETVSVLREASQEIKELRQQNAYMSGRLEMFDSMMLLFRTAPNFQGTGMKEDVVWKIEKLVKEAQVL